MKLAEEVLLDLSQLSYVSGFFEARIIVLMYLLANKPNDCHLPDSAYKKAEDSAKFCLTQVGAMTGK